MAQLKSKGADWREKEPFHVQPHHLVNADDSQTLLGYTIMFRNRSLLTSKLIAEHLNDPDALRLSRPQVYAICKLLNADKKLRKWAERFADPYV